MTKDDALKMALEAWQTSAYGTAQHHKAMLVAMTEVGKKVLEQPKQERVEWGVDWGHNGERSCVVIVKKYSDGRIKVVANEVDLETSPPPMREWVSLTNEDRLVIDNEYINELGSVEHFKAVEEKLRELNQ